MKSRSARTTPPSTATFSEFVIVGGGLAGATTVETLLSGGVAGNRITLVAAEPELPYHRPPLSKGYLLGKRTRDSVFVKPKDFYERAGVMLLLGTKVTTVQPEAHTVTTDQGETLQYGKLLLATGCAVRKLTVPGGDLPGVFTLRTLADADALRAAQERAKSVLIVGGSFIGMELASAFAQKERHTTLLHRGKEVFDKLASPEASAFFARYYEERGVSIRTEDEATAVERRLGSDGPLTVTTKRGDTVTADFVAVGIGVAPDTQYLETSGITLDNGIVVNEYLEASVPDVYAAGDVANFFDPLYARHRRIEHWDTAIQHGKIAGANLLGKHEAYSAVSYFFSDVFDLSFDYFGDATDTDHTILRGSFADKAVTLFYLQGSIVRAAFTMGRPKEQKVLKALIRTQQPLPDPTILSDEGVPLPAP